LGFRVSGKVAPDTVKPAPVRLTELIVNAAVPLEARVTDCAEGVFRFTLPKERLPAFRVSAGRAAFNCKAKLADWLPAATVSVANCADVTAETVAVKPALVALAGIVTVAGKLTAGLLLDRAKVIPPLGAAPFSETVQESDPAPVIAELVHEIALRVARPVPLRLIVAVPPEEALLEMVSVPVAAPADVGSNCTCRVAV